MVASRYRVMLIKSNKKHSKIKQLKNVKKVYEIICKRTMTPLANFQSIPVQNISQRHVLLKVRG